MEQRSTRSVTATLDGAPYTTRLDLDGHALVADEPEDLGGANEGPRPHDLLCASLAACTAITLRMYADRKGWPSGHIGVTVDMDRTSKDGRVETAFSLRLALDPALSEEQKGRMLQIARSCPVHRTLENPIHLKASLA